jgi:hypothetical protein
MKAILNPANDARMLPRLRRLAANPVLILTVSAVASLVVSYISVFYLRFSAWTLFYNLPVGVAFLVFCFDRLLVLGRQPLAAYALDAILLAVAITRMFVLVPFYSGHTVFLVYFVGTAHTPLARLVAFAVLVQVAIVKVMLGDGTLISGALLAAAAVFVYRTLAGGHSATAIA